MQKNNHLTKKAVQQLSSFLDHCHITDPSGKTILEIGFKNGVFLDQAQHAGLIATGTEINSTYVENTKKQFPLLNLILCHDDTIALPDESFDFIVSFQVLEHVGRVETVLDECVRLLKPGGVMYHVCPNYRFFYEGHYNVIWLPFLNHTLGRTYLKLLRRYSPYYEHLNLITPGRVKRYFIKHAHHINLISLGKKEFRQNFNPQQAQKIANPLLHKLATLLTQCPILKDATPALLTGLGLYYPLTIIAQKQS